MKEKFKEAIAIHLACLGCHTGVMDDLSCRQMWDEMDKGFQLEYLDLVDQLFAIEKDGCRVAIVKDGNEIDIPDSVFFAPESRACGFTKRSFLEAGWVQEVK